MEDSFDLAILSPATHARLMATAAAMLHNFLPSSKTTSPGWEYLVRASGNSRATVGRHLKLLEKLGYLGVVATGRQAEFTPKSTGRTENDRAVYVLCRPMTTAEVAAVQPVDKPEILTTSSVDSYPPHAPADTSVEDKMQADTASRRRSFIAAAFGRAEGELPVDRSVAQWPATQRINPAWTKGERRAAELQASLEMQRRSFPLRALSTKHLAFVCRDFFAAGWAVRDLLIAIDNRPDSRRWQHDGAHGVADVAKWMAYRLAAWRSGERVHHSPTQLEERRSAQGAAQARAAAERRLNVQCQRGEIAAVASRGAAMVRAALRAARSSDCTSGL